MSDEIPTERRTKSYSTFKLSPAHGLLLSLTATTPSGTPDEPSDSKSPVSYHGRCGDRNNFPCSCAGICIVHGNCCYDMKDKCRSLVDIVRVRFRHLGGAAVECSGVTNTFMVMSCSDLPSPEVKSIAAATTLSTCHVTDGRLGLADTSKHGIFPSGTAGLFPTSPSDHGIRTAGRADDSRSSTTQTAKVNEETYRSNGGFLSLFVNTPVTDQTVASSLCSWIHQ